MTRFAVNHTALDTAAQSLPDQVTVLGEARRHLTARTLSTNAFANVPGSQHAQTGHLGNIQAGDENLRAASSRLTGVIDGIKSSNAAVRRWDAQKAAEIKKLNPDLVVPVLNGGAGGSIAERNSASRARIELARDAAEEEMRKLQGSVGPVNREMEIQQLREKIAAYDEILNSNTQILSFNGEGRLVALVGDLNSDTRSVAVLVPGMNTGVEDFVRYTNTVGSFAQADTTGGTAGVLWMDGDFPQGLIQASGAEASQEMAPRLADFVNGDLRPQLGENTKVTVIGHSYGGATVGLADAAGMRADNVVHVASAGMGSGVTELTNMYPENRYSVTMERDPIQWAQGRAHGPDPDDFPGVTPLPSSRDNDGWFLPDVGSHSSILAPGTDSWNDINSVVNGSIRTSQVLH
ncbi:alpha/beta hydrolase family protein [Saccharopolyspora indica]|uniref:alpha/beta hydrolase n=1 Tax=Saccharopolyspora indica TaxID=1229659 RepID=UPI0022EB62FD|nr:alpha/beta hydrolase [Saccharopolyspora indica]MDA3642844.1 alpha/beta hydrolase [Saccharopolyspora indica]